MVDPNVFWLGLLGFLGFSAIPIFLFLLDGYFQKKMGKAIKYIVLFGCFLAALVIGIMTFGVYFAMIAPLLVFVFALLQRSKNPSDE